MGLFSLLWACAVAAGAGEEPLLVAFPPPPPLWGKRGVGGREGNFGKVAEEGERSRFCRGEGVGGEARAFLGVPRGSARLVSLPRGPWGRRGKVVFFCWGFFCSFLSVSGVGRPRTGRTGGGRSGLAAPGLRPAGRGGGAAGGERGWRKENALFLPVLCPLRYSDRLSLLVEALFSGPVPRVPLFLRGLELPGWGDAFFHGACSCSQGDYPARLSEVRRNPCFKIVIIPRVVITSSTSTDLERRDRKIVGRK